MDVNAYLERINYRGSLLPAPESLCDLQLSHLSSVPFENLSIHSGEPIILQLESLFEKIVLNKRGGFCYELNGLFAALLRELGFSVTMLSAEVAKTDGGFGPAFDHLTLMVLLEQKWLVDVGFGDTFLRPLLIDEQGIQPQENRAYKVINDGNYFLLKEKNITGEWKEQYRFTLKPCNLNDFKQMCNYHQTSTESRFTQSRICTIAKDVGRVTLSEMSLIETVMGERRERILRDELEYAAILEKEFGIILKQHNL